ncbi:hypothetical protein MBLNU459_g3904t2 [Dothideomycetes sp. NU459]
MADSRENSGSQTEKDNEGAAAPLHQSGGSTQSGGATTTSPSKKKLPPFLDHFNSRDLKIWFRCSVSLWAASLLVFIGPSLRAFGTAAFFGCIVNLFLPPSGVVFVFLIGGATMILGMALAWAWGVIAMKAALATRPASETLAREQMLAQTASRSGISAQVLVFEGFMLDTRVTVTYFCMLGLFIYLMARLRMKAPKLSLTAVFAWIITDVFLTIGPLLPAFSGTIPEVLIKPAAAAIAISLACSILIFPESTSHLVLFGMHKLVDTSISSLDATAQCIAKYPDDSSVETLEALRTGLIGGWGALEPSMAFLPLDFSVGLWNAQDIATLKGPLRRVIVGALSLLDFELLQNRRRNRLRTYLPDEDGDSTEDTHTSKIVHEHGVGRHQVMESLNLLETMHQPDVQGSIQASYHALSQAGDPLVQACRAALGAMSDSIKQNNSRRWFGRLSAEQSERMHQDHLAVLEQLRIENARYASATNDALLQSHRHLFNEQETFQDVAGARPKLSGLFVGFNLEDRFLRLANSTEAALAQILLLEGERTKRRFWFPVGLRHFATWMFGTSGTPALDAPTSDDFPEVDKKALADMHARLKGANRPVKKRNKFSSLVLGFVHWLSNDHGIFALRLVLATMSVAVIGACTSTAGFFYREKGLWAVIMAQTGMVTYFSDFTYQFVTRVFGTVLGGVIGLAGWYIGSGNGPGNPYGLAAVMAVIALILMWFRLYAPPQFLTTVILSGATIVLVIGYSYIDTHNPSYGNPGVGYEVFWRRTVLVLVGFGVTFIVSLIPWPSSQSRFVAKTLAQVLHAEADHYALLLNSWRDLGDDKKLLPAIEGVAIHLSETMSALNGPIANLGWEFSSSAFDSATCSKLKRALEFINASLTQLHMRATMLPPHYRDRFAKSSGMLDHRSIGDVMVVMAVIEQSLKTGDPLPSILPTPLLKRGVVYGHGADVSDLTMDMLKDEAFRGYTVTMSAYLGFLAAVDEVVLIMKTALGESHYVPENLTGLD